MVHKKQSQPNNPGIQNNPGKLRTPVMSIVPKSKEEQVKEHKDVETSSFKCQLGPYILLAVVMVHLITQCANITEIFVKNNWKWKSC